MRVLVDIVHPADVLFFLRPIRMLLARNDDVIILSRDKDVTTHLLDLFGLTHRPASKAGFGLIALATELACREFTLWRMIRRSRPHVMIGFGGVAIAHVGKLTGVPSIAFYDSENAALQTRITWPFVTRLYVPDSYGGPVPTSRTVRIRGTKDLSYLHPTTFAPSRDIAIRCNLDPDRNNFLIRIVSWRASHDVGKSGWTQETLIRLVGQLERLGRVHISSERRLPDVLNRFAFTGLPHEIHHLMAYCRLFVGESVTMACESATLGVPSIYVGHDMPGYVRAIARAGLVTIMNAQEVEGLPEAIDRALIRPMDEFRMARTKWLEDCPDWAAVVVDAIDQVAQPEDRHVLDIKAATNGR
jgi:predicted glycosyltransferase